MNARGSSGNVVSDAQVYEWRHRIRAIDAQIESLTLEREKLGRLVDMAEMLESEARLLTRVSGHQHDALDGIDRSDTFIKAVFVVAGRFEDGATYDDLKEAIAKSALGEKLAASDKGFYTGIAKLKQRGELIDHNGFIFTQKNLEIYRRKVAAGLKPNKVRDPASEKRDSPVYGLLLGVIAREPNLSAKEVIQRVREGSEQGRELTENVNSVYNAIARLKKRGVIEGVGRLERDLRIGPNASEEFKRIASGGVVVHLAKRSEAPSGRAAGASENGPLFGLAPRK